MIDGYWLPVRDGDPRALSLYLRHYSAHKARHGARSARPGNASRFMGPGEHMLLLTMACDAVFGWRRQLVRDDGERGVECNLFHSVAPVRSSTLIREACALAWSRWPGARLFTFVDPRAVRSSNPGWCFLQAGWHRLARRTTRGLRILELQP